MSQVIAVERHSAATTTMNCGVSYLPVSEWPLFMILIHYMTLETKDKGSLNCNKGVGAVVPVSLHPTYSFCSTQLLLFGSLVVSHVADTQPVTAPSGIYFFVF